MMKTRKIGKTELEVTEISIGAAALGGLYRACPRDEAMETLEAASGGRHPLFRRGTLVWPWPRRALRRRLPERKARRTEYSALRPRSGRLLRPVPTGTVPDYSDGVRPGPPSRPIMTIPTTASCDPSISVMRAWVSTASISSMSTTSVLIRMAPRKNAVHLKNFLDLRRQGA